MSHPWVRWEWVNSQKRRDFSPPGPAPAEAREATQRGGLKPRPHRPRADDLVHLHGGLQPFDRYEAERLDLDVPLRGLPGLARPPWSSWASGAPKRAMMPSPITWFTVPS